MRRPLLLLIAMLATLTLAAPVAAATNDAPSAPAAASCSSNCLRVYSITIYDWLAADAEAHVKVVDENGGAIRGAVVHGVWRMPDGTELDRYDIIGTRLRAEFPLYSDQSGTHTFTVAGISLAGYQFDPSGSATLSASIDLNGSSQAGCTVDCVSVTKIKMSERRDKVRATTFAKDENGTAVRATITGTWTLPDGSTLSQSLNTNRKGKTRFKVHAADPGVYTFTIQSVTAPGLTDDSANGVTSGTYTVQ